MTDLHSGGQAFIFRERPTGPNGGRSSLKTPAPLWPQGGSPEQSSLPTWLIYWTTMPLLASAGKNGRKMGTYGRRIQQRLVQLGQDGPDEKPSRKGHTFHWQLSGRTSPVEETVQTIMRRQTSHNYILVHQRSSRIPPHRVERIWNEMSRYRDRLNNLTLLRCLLQRVSHGESITGRAMTLPSKTCWQSRTPTLQFSTHRETQQNHVWLT